MTRCLVCEQPIGVSEPRTHREDAATGEQHVAHRACVSEGVHRWCRDNRPHSSPLEAARKESWNWPGSGPDAVMTLRDYAQSYGISDE